MHSLLIVDDNELFRESLKTSSLWENHRLTIVGEAENGIDALQSILSIKPEVVLMDINLPGLSGLEVIQKAKEKGSDSLFIIISAYDDFSFAQKGLKMGVFDYLLKPINDQKIIEILKRLKVFLKDKRKKAIEENRIAEYNRKLELTSFELKQKLLGDGVRGYFRNEKELEGLVKGNGETPNYELMLLMPETEHRQHLEDFIRFEEGIFRELERAYDVELIDTWCAKGLIIMASYKKLDYSLKYDINGMKLARALLKKTSDGGFSISIGISALQKRLEKLPEAYEQASTALEKRFFSCDHQINHFTSLNLNIVNKELTIGKEVQDIVRTLNNYPQEIVEKIDELYEKIMESKIRDSDFVKKLYTQISLTMTCNFNDRFPANGKTLTMKELMKTIDSFSTLEEIHNWVDKYSKRLMSLYQKTDDCISLQTRKILDYIDKNYHKPLNMATIAATAHLSQGHIGRLLKNETGDTFLNILNKIRIKNAIRLLKEGNFKVYEIATAVGYSNYAYFYQLFKKVTGKSPTDYQ